MNWEVAVIDVDKVTKMMLFPLVGFWNAADWQIYDLQTHWRGCKGISVFVAQKLFTSDNLIIQYYRSCIGRFNYKEEAPLNHVLFGDFLIAQWLGCAYMRLANEKSKHLVENINCKTTYGTLH